MSNIAQQPQGRAPVLGVDKLIVVAIIASVVFYFTEIEIFRSVDSLSGPAIFLWLERFIATLLTAEYILRIRDAGENKWKYICSPLGIIDLISIAPFWFGFYAPDTWLGAIRSVRILRLAKFYRYSEGLQSLFRGLKKERRRLRAVGAVVTIMLLFSTAFMHQVEGEAQPDKFGTLSGSLWWTVVTMTTVGYGDVFPVTAIGKIVAMGVMLTGIGTLGSFVGIIGTSVFADIKSDFDDSKPVSPAPQPRRRPRRKMVRRAKNPPTTTLSSL